MCMCDFCTPVQPVAHNVPVFYICVLLCELMLMQLVCMCVCVCLHGTNGSKLLVCQYKR